jgi:hypothetical protein
MKKLAKLVTLILVLVSLSSLAPQLAGGCDYGAPGGANPCKD